MDVTYQPLTQWPVGRPRTLAADRREAQFKTPRRAEFDAVGAQRIVQRRVMPLARTLHDLDSELFLIGVGHAVIQVDVTNRQDLRSDLRRDGVIRDDARVHSPAVVLSFTRHRSPLVFACDHFNRWQDNLRAIVLGLEALRKIERYHIGSGMEQYRGWQALPASTTPALSTEQAAAVLARRENGTRSAADLETRADMITHDIAWARDAYRKAAAKTHPDSGGSHDDFTLVQEAKRVLEAHHGATF